MEVIEQRIEEFKTWYDSQQPYHHAAVHFLCDLIATIPQVKSVIGRTKDYDECISKFKRKYLPLIKTEDHDYTISSYLTDLIGIRAVCNYSDEVRDIQRLLKKYFRETEITDKSGQLEQTEDKFGYKSLHLQLVLKSRLKGVADARKFKGLRFELQIRTVIQDAWSILDHQIKYKKSIPQNLKRRINRLSALFEIADDEFLNIREEIAQQERMINKRLIKGDKIKKTKVLDVFSFLFVALKYFPDYKFIEYKVDGFVQDLLLQKRTFTEGELNEALKTNLSYVNQIESEIKQRLNPYTKIRYCLYKHDQDAFKKILSFHQQGIFKRIGDH